MGLNQISDVDVLFVWLVGLIMGLNRKVMWMLLAVWLVESDNGIESDSDVDVVSCVVS